MGHTLKLALLLGLVALLAACGPAPTATPAPGPHLTDADVPRVSPADAKAALDSGEAVLVDVRSAGSYELEHAAGALSVPLGDIEEHPAAVPLDKAKWIITYCT
jgi:3-mercaptopyruvate sulfurtransferase SseA